MTAQTILVIILVIISISFLLERILSYLNVKSQSNNLPEELKGIYDEEKYQQSLSYHKANTKFSFLTATLSFAVTFALLFSGAFGYLSNWIGTYFSDSIPLSLAFFGVLFIASDVLTIPFQVYSTFVIEEKFGFNKTTPKTFIIDKLKGYILALLIGGAILWALLSLITSLGSGFWIYFWLIIAVFSLLANMFYTSLILPLFNKLTPLEDGELKETITDYSHKINFPINNIFVIDGSKRSAKSNAFFSGFGKKKKIVLYDTLIKNHSTKELVAVLAHEVGHYKKKHIITSLILGTLQIGIMLFIMSKMIFNEQLSIALGAESLAIHLNLIAFSILYSPISSITGLFMNMLSRKNEYEADAYATATFDGNALQIALKKLSVDNLSNLTPHPMYVFFHYSHPPLMKRLKAIAQVK